MQRSVVLQSVLVIGSALTYSFSGNVPFLHTSRYMIARDQFHQAFPCVSTAINKCWVEKAWVRDNLSPISGDPQDLHQ